MPLADCLRPFNQSDRHKVQPLINELRQAVGDDHLLEIQTELFDVLVKIVGNFPLSSGSGYFWPGSYIDFSLKLSCIALNLLRQRIQFFTMPLAQKEFETQLLKLLVLTICFFFNLRITAMTFCVAAENGDEFRFEVPYEDWFKEHEGQELTLYHNVDPDPEAAAGNINRLVLKYLPESLQKRFAKSFKRGYLALLSKFIRGDVGSIVKDEFILILISQAESILREQMTTEFARQGEEPPHYIPSILSWAICALLANELSPEAALRKSDAIGNKEPLQIVARAITCKDGEIYAVIEYFFPLLTAKLQELFPRQTWREKEVLRMCCQCGIFDLKEGATFEEVANRIEIYKKCGKEVVSTPVQGLRFNNFLLYVANDSYFGRTVQSLQAKHSVDANAKENSVVKTGAQSVAQQTGPSSSSNAQSKSDEPSDSKNPSVDSASETSSGNDAEKPKAKRGRRKKADTQTANAPENAVAATHTKQAASQKASSEAKPASAAKPKANTAASGQPKSNAAPSDQNPPKAKRGRKPKALQSANSQASSEAAKSKEVSIVQAAKADKTAKTAKSAAQTKASAKPAAKTVKATSQAKAEVKPVPNTRAKAPSSGKSSAKAIQAALTA